MSKKVLVALITEEEGYILTCIACPIGRVVIDAYDLVNGSLGSAELIVAGEDFSVPKPSGQSS